MLCWHAGQAACMAAPARTHGCGTLAVALITQGCATAGPAHAVWQARACSAAGRAHLAARLGDGVFCPLQLRGHVLLPLLHLRMCTKGIHSEQQGSLAWAAGSNPSSGATCPCCCCSCAGVTEAGLRWRPKRWHGMAGRGALNRLANTAMHWWNRPTARPHCPVLSRLAQRPASPP